jgi:hypothetical protein
VPDDKLSKRTVLKGDSRPSLPDLPGSSWRESGRRFWQSPIPMVIPPTIIAVAAIWTIYSLYAVFTTLGSVLFVAGSILAVIAFSTLLSRIRKVKEIAREANDEYKSQRLAIRTQVEINAIAVIRKEIDDLGPMAQRDRMRLRFAADLLIDALRQQFQEDT